MHPGGFAHTRTSFQLSWLLKYNLPVGLRETIPERQVLSECETLLAFYKKSHRLDYWRISTTGIPRAQGNKTVFGKNPSAGMTDLIILIANGPTIFCEVKSPTGKLSPKQDEFIERMAHVYSHSRIHSVVRSHIELASLIDRVLVSIS
jgi:hypothetical protein